jgi:hypothetical protein
VIQSITNDQHDRLIAVLTETGILAAGTDFWGKLELEFAASKLKFANAYETRQVKITHSTNAQDAV